MHFVRIVTSPFIFVEKAGLMKSFQSSCWVVVLLLAGIAASGCSGEPRVAHLVDEPGVIKYASADTLFPQLVFADGQTSLNDRCMVRRIKLNSRLPGLYVNGSPVGFC
jgi:hypothetical protein